MIPVDQDVVGPRGRCFSACLASLLEVPLDTVPSFLREPGDTHVFQWAERLDAWLAPFGLYALHFSADPSRAAFPGCYHIITGISPRGRPHACIGYGPRVIHDPHPDKTGLTAIDGFCLLVPRFEEERRARRGASLDEARVAQAALKDVLGHPDWLSGIGIDKGEDGGYRVRVNTAWLDSDVIAAIPSEILGVPVSVMRVGRIHALAAGYFDSPSRASFLEDIRRRAEAQRPRVSPRLSEARDRLETLLTGRPGISWVSISCAGARLPDGSYVDTRPPGKGLLMEGETRPQLNAVSVSVERRVTADEIRARVGDEIMGVPIVYSVREEWSKRMPVIGRPLGDDEMPGWG